MIFLAPHGGFIEPGTDVLCRSIAGDLFSNYSFIANYDDDTFGPEHPLHITSHLFNLPVAEHLVAMHEEVCSLHIFEEEGYVIHIGGRDLQMSRELSEHLNVYGFETIYANGKNGGMHPDNICNRGVLRAGVQLEISSGLMDPLVVNEELTDLGELFSKTVQEYWLSKEFYNI